MPYYAVFVVKPEVWAAVVCSLQKTAHLVLVKIYHAYVAVVIFVVSVIGT